MKTENKAPIQEGIRLSPWVIAFSFLAFVGVQTLFYFATRDSPPPLVVRILLVPFAGLAVALYILVAGYVNLDSKRRGMNSLLWTLLVIFVPNGIGFIIYFLTQLTMAAVVIAANPCRFVIRFRSANIPLPSRLFMRVTSAS